MGADVQQTIHDIVMNKGKMSDEQAKEYITKLQKDGRYVQELWAGA